VTTITKTHESKNTKVTVKLTRTVSDKTSYADGYNIKLGREVVEYFDIALRSKTHGFTKEVFGSRTDYEMPRLDSSAPKGAVGCMGHKVWLSQEVYDIITRLMDEAEVELPKSEEQIAIESAKAEEETRWEDWKNSPDGKAKQAEWESYEQFKREMERADSDY